MTNLCPDNYCNVCLDDTPLDVRERDLLKSCSKCHGLGAKYCNKDCQTRDWPIHKIFCGVSSPPASVANEGNTIRALFFPVDSKAPTLVRVQVGANFPGGVDATQHIPGTLGGDVKCYSSEQLPHYENNEIYCGFSLYYGKQSKSDTENKCIKHVLSGFAKARYGSGLSVEIMGRDYWKTHLDGLKKWTGPLLLVKSDRYKKNGLSNPTHEDFDVRDVPYLVIYLGLLSKLMASQ